MKVAKQLSLEQLEAGMVVAQNVCSIGGGCLLAPGMVLSDAIIDALRRHNVVFVMVGEEEILSPAQRAAREAEIRERIELLFRQSGNDPLLLKLRATVLQYRLAGLD